MIYVIVAMLLVLVGLLYYSRLKTERESTNKKSDLKNQVKQLQSSFQESTKTLLIQQMITPAEKDKIYAIANNYFVFQPVNDDNLTHMESLLVQFSGIISQEMFAGEAMVDAFKLRLKAFAERLPAEPRGFSRSFYRDQLPGMLALLEERPMDLVAETAPDELVDEPGMTADDAEDTGQDTPAVADNQPR